MRGSQNRFENNRRIERPSIFFYFKEEKRDCDPAF